MKLEEIQQQSPAVLDYLERYVNDGSPSGFSLIGQLSDQTNPLGFTPYFSPLVPTNQAQFSLEFFRSRFLDTIPGAEQMLFHPDMRSVAEAAGFQLSRNHAIRLVPTSSGRTARCLDPDLGVYYKFHFEGILGRIERSLPRHKAIAGIEISDEIVQLIHTERISEVGILPEVCAIAAVTKMANPAIWGIVIRRWRPYPEPVGSPFAVLPLFSLTSIDRLSPRDSTFLKQLWRLDPQRSIALIRDIGLNAIRIFVGLYNGAGLQYEMNAQNLLVALDANYVLRRLIIRDFNSTEKDITMRLKLSLPTTFAAGKYKCISAEEDGNMHRIRHSFAFDFKLSKYIVQPLIEELARCDSAAAKAVLEDIRRAAPEHLAALPADFFPEGGTWFSHPEVDLSRNRPYISNANPYLR